MARHWSRWTEATTNRRIFGAAVVIASLSLAVRLASVSKEIAVAKVFGTGDALDAFLMASLLPTYTTLVIGSSFKAALIPVYVRVRDQEGDEAARKLFSNVMVCGFLLLTLAAALMVLAAPIYLPVIASGFNSGKIELTRSLLEILSPVIVLYGIGALWGAVLNADRRFGLVAAAPVLTPLVILFLLVTGGAKWGVFTLAYGTVAGVCLEAALIGVALKRAGLSIIPRWYGADSSLRQVIRQFAPMISGAVIMCGTDFVDQAMAAMLGPGSLSALNYGRKIVSVPMNLAATALGTAVIPYFSTMVANKDWAAANHTLKRFFILIFAVSVPMTLILILFSDPIVALLFQRGSFGAEDTHLVSSIQSLFALQIPFYIAGILTLRLISSMQANKVFMIGNILNLVLCVSLNLVFMKLMGISGIALSTSCVYLVSFFYLYYSWRRITRQSP